MIFGQDDSNPQGPQDKPQQQIRLETGRMETVFANFFALAGAPDEVTIYLGANTPMPGMKQPVIQVSHRVILNPPNAKRLMMALQQTVKAHEDRFGPIEIPPPQPPRRQ
jgi:hypothetical protein